MKKIAQLCGVSEAAVSYTLRGKRKVNSDTRERILAIAEKYNYRPNALVRSIQKKRSMTVGVAFNNIGNEYAGWIMEGVMQMLQARGYQVLMINWAMAAREGVHVLRVMGERRVDGILMFPPEEVEPRTYLNEMRTFHAPMVLVDRKWPQCEYDTVGSNDRQGGFDLTAHLIQLGHRRIANFHNSAEKRSEGFRDAMLKFGVPVRAEWILKLIYLEEQYEQARRLLSARDRPTAIMCFNDEAALTVYSAAYDLGLKVPEDLSVTGFGDLLVGKTMRPRLTTVRQDPCLIGRQAAELLLRRIENHNGQETNIPETPEDILLPTELVIRDSTSAPAEKIVERGA